MNNETMETERTSYMVVRIFVSDAFGDDVPAESKKLLYPNHGAHGSINPGDPWGPMGPGRPAGVIGFPVNLSIKKLLFRGAGPL